MRLVDGGSMRRIVMSFAALLALSCELVLPVHENGAPGTDAGGAKDVATTGDGGDAGYCASISPRPFFCDDFDERQTPAQGWSGEDLGTGATLTIDKMHAESPPASVLMTTQGGAASGLEESAQAASSFHVSFDLLADELGSDDFGSLLVVQVTDGGTNDTFQLFVYATSAMAYVEEDSWAPSYMNVGKYDLPAPPPIGTWTHFDLTIDFASSPSTFTLSSGGSEVFKAHPLALSWPSGSYRTTFGFYYVNNSVQPWAVNYDDIVIDVR